MIAHSQLFEEASRYSHTMATVVDLYVGDTLQYPDVPVVSGTVTCDRGSKVRWTASIEIARYPWEEMPTLDVNRARFVVHRGLTSLGRTEMLQLGEYRVDKISRSDTGHLAVDGSGLEAYVLDSRFLTPRVPPYGQSTIEAIRQLIVEAVPSSAATVVAQNTRDKRVQATAPWDRDRMDAVLALADSIDAEVFADSTGTFVIRDRPSLNGVPVFTVGEGDGGALVSRSQDNSRDGVYNAVVASGQSTDQDVPPVWGWAYDGDTASPTYFYGEFGQKPRFYSSQYLYTVDQCTATAQSMLDEALAATRTLSFETLPLCFLEAGDIVRVQLDGGGYENHLLQKTSIGLSHSSAMSCDTYVNTRGGDV